MFTKLKCFTFGKCETLAKRLHKNLNVSHLEDVKH